MRLGLLQCDHVLEDLQPVFGDLDGMFRRWLPVEWRIYDVTKDELPRDLQECDGYATTGSRFSVYDDFPWIRALAELVRSLHAADKPFLGVCFGHQMMAHALGGRVAKSSQGWGIGIHEFRILESEPWMDPPLDTACLLMSCQDQVQELPPGARVLAGNDFCPVGVFRVGSLLGIQAHPEFTTQYAETLMERRVERIGAERVAAARATLNRRPNSAELARWAANFIEGFM